MPIRSLVRTTAAVLLLAAIAGCSSGPPPETIAAPPVPGADSGFPRVVEGADDSVGSIPGSPDAPYRFRFKMVEPAGDFSFRDRDLSFYFKPAPDALHFQIENLQNRPVWIDWERSVFYDPNGGSGETAHLTTRWADRFQNQPMTQIPGLSRYSDYVLPLEYLLDPSGRDEQIHKQLLPEDATSPQYTDRVFGVDLTFLVEDRPRVYPFRFRVVSVIPR